MGEEIAKEVLNTLEDFRLTGKSFLDLKKESKCKVFFYLAHREIFLYSFLVEVSIKRSG